MISYTPCRTKSAFSNSDKRIALGNWLHEQRQTKGLTMRDLQAISGKPHSYFGKIEQAKRGLDVLEFLELCDWLGIDATESIKAVKML